MRTLRGRLILSHILPTLLVVPLVAVALIYVLETQVLLTDLSEELAREGKETAAMASGQPVIWTDNAEAQQFVSLYSLRARSKVMLFDADGNLLASSDPKDVTTLGRPPYPTDIQAALAGQQLVHVAHSTRLEAEIVQVLVPVLGPNQEVVGVVRLSQHLLDLRDQFARFRRLIAGALGVALVLGVVIGLALALSLGRSLRSVTDGIYSVATGGEWQTLPEQDPVEIRMLLRAFNTLIERLRVLEESRRQLLANLVHELGRPIGALQAAIQALVSGAEEDPALRHELLEGMEGQVQRLRPLLDSLTDLHGQVLGTLELNLQPVRLGEWLPPTVTSWRQAAHDQGLHWRMDIPETLPIVEIDPDRMAQVLGNLLSNAIKYSPEGTISVTAAAQGKGVAIVVGDTGIGIAASEQDRIFEPFFRSNRDRRFPQGMGLGLSIARDLVVAHGGRIQVESAPGQGSRFTIWLPLASSRPSLPES